MVHKIYILSLYFFESCSDRAILRPLFGIKGLLLLTFALQFGFFVSFHSVTAIGSFRLCKDRSVSFKLPTSASPTIATRPRPLVQNFRQIALSDEEAY
jgi:hypothetical protein